MSLYIHIQDKIIFIGNETFAEGVFVGISGKEVYTLQAYKPFYSAEMDVISKSILRKKKYFCIFRVVKLFEACIALIARYHGFLWSKNSQSNAPELYFWFKWSKKVYVEVERLNELVLSWIGSSELVGYFWQEWIFHKFGLYRRLVCTSITKRLLEKSCFIQ